MAKSATALEERLESFLIKTFDKEGDEGVQFSVHPSRVDGSISTPPETEPFDFEVECLYRHADQVPLPEGSRDAFSGYLFNSRFGSYEQVNVWRFPGGILSGTVRCPEDNGNDESNVVFTGEAWLSENEEVLDGLEKTLKDRALSEVLGQGLRNLSRYAKTDPEAVSRVISSMRNDNPLSVGIVIPAIHQGQGVNPQILRHEESLLKVRNGSRIVSEERRYPRDWHVVSVTVDLSPPSFATPVPDSHMFPVLDILCSAKTKEEAEGQCLRTYGDDSCIRQPNRTVRGLVLSTEEVRMLPNNFSHFGFDADFSADSLRLAVGIPPREEAEETPEEAETAGPGM